MEIVELMLGVQSKRWDPRQEVALLLQVKLKNNLQDAAKEALDRRIDVLRRIILSGP
ncbi:MAG: hypothetical protein WC246_02025 [Candidatus Paceibacterota bacterium]